MMQCQLCNDQDGPFEFADVYDDGRAKVMLICENCGNEIRKMEKKHKKEIPYWQRTVRR